VVRLRVIYGEASRIEFAMRSVSWRVVQSRTSTASISRIRDPPRTTLSLLKKSGAVI
jgi:hypothetical protein